MSENPIKLAGEGSQSREAAERIRAGKKLVAARAFARNTGYGTIGENRRGVQSTDSGTTIERTDLTEAERLGEVAESGDKKFRFDVSTRQPREDGGYTEVRVIDVESDPNLPPHVHLSHFNEQGVYQGSEVVNDRDVIAAEKIAAEAVEQAAEELNTAARARVEAMVAAYDEAVNS